MTRRKLPAFDLKAAREVRGLSQTATAILLCTTQPSISRWEEHGNLPAIYRKAWQQHWTLEDMQNKAPAKTKKKSAIQKKMHDNNIAD